jgi:protein TilB
MTDKMTQKNEGEWEFTLDMTEDGSCVELEVEISRHLDAALVQACVACIFGSTYSNNRSDRRHNTLLVTVQADVQPHWARLLIKGRLLQLKLPCAVCPNLSRAQRSKASGRLLITMPRESLDTKPDITCMRPRKRGKHAAKPGPPCTSSFATRQWWLHGVSAVLHCTGRAYVWCGARPTT